MSIKMNVRYRLQNRTLPILTALVFIVYLLDPFRGWLVLLTGLAGALLSGAAWSFLLSKNLRLVHERRYGWAQVGDRLEERFILRNSGPVPAVWVDVDYMTTMPDYDPGRAIGVPARSEVAWQTGGICTRRGVFTLGPTLLRTGDPLGVFRVEISYPSETTLLVTPPSIPLPEIRIAPGGRAGESRIRQHAFSTSVSASHVREYVPGDSIRMIHWPTTARKEDYFVRDLENTPAGDWWVFLDLDEEHQAGTGFQSTVEHGVILAASLVEMGLQRGNAVGLVTQGRGLSWLPPQFGEAHHQKIMQALALADAGEITLSGLLQQARPVFRQNPSLILITANLSTSWVADVLPLVRRRIVPTALIFDPAGYPGGAQSLRPGPLLGFLEAQGVAHALLDPSIFDRPEAQPGKQGRWKWTEARSGRAVATAVPENLPWRRIWSDE